MLGSEVGVTSRRSFQVCQLNDPGFAGGQRECHLAGFRSTDGMTEAPLKLPAEEVEVCACMVKSDNAEILPFRQDSEHDMRCCDVRFATPGRECAAYCQRDAGSGGVGTGLCTAHGRVHAGPSTPANDRIVLFDMNRTPRRCEP